MKIIPSLLPMLLLTNIFIKGGFFIKIINKIPRSKNIIIILLLILLGSPSSITFLNDIKKQNIINEQEKDILFSSFGGISFPFLFNLTILYPSLKGIWFLLIYYLGEFIVYFFQKNKYSKIKNIKNVSINRSIYINSIKDSFKSLSIIICSSLLFNYIFCINLNAYNKYPLLTCLIEFSYSSFISLNNSNYITPLFIIMILSFTSISLFFQVYYLDPFINLEKLIKKRWLISTINSCLFFIFFF